MAGHCYYHTLSLLPLVIIRHRLLPLITVTYAINICTLHGDWLLILRAIITILLATIGYYGYYITHYITTTSLFQPLRPCFTSCQQLIFSLRHCYYIAYCYCVIIAKLATLSLLHYAIIDNITTSLIIRP